MPDLKAQLDLLTIERDELKAKMDKMAQALKDLYDAYDVMAKCVTSPNPPHNEWRARVMTAAALEIPAGTKSDSKIPKLPEKVAR